MTQCRETACSPSCPGRRHMKRLVTSDRRWQPCVLTTSCVTLERSSGSQVSQGRSGATLQHQAILSCCISVPLYSTVNSSLKAGISLQQVQSVCLCAGKKRGRARFATHLMCLPRDYGTTLRLQLTSPACELPLGRTWLLQGGTDCARLHGLQLSIAWRHASFASSSHDVVFLNPRSSADHALRTASLPHDGCARQVATACNAPQDFKQSAQAS